MAERVLVVEGVRKRFGGVQALSGLLFSVGVAEVVGLIEPNGSGKSTCVNALSDTFPLTAGSVSLAGCDFHDVSIDERVRLGLSRSFQTTTMFAEMTAIEQVLTACHARFADSVLLMRQFDPVATLRVIGVPAIRSAHFFGVPANYLFMAHHPNFASADLPLLDAWAQHGAALQQNFDMTKTGPSVTLLGRKDMCRKIGLCGKALVHEGARVVDDQGHDADTNQVGELLVRGLSFTQGYWRREAQTRESFIGDWVRIGDAPRCDADSPSYIAEHWKDRYTSSSENFYPAEVENILSELPEIFEAVEIGIADAKWDETGCAAVVLHPGRQLTAEAVRSHRRSKLATFKVTGRDGARRKPATWRYRKCAEAPVTRRFRSGRYVCPVMKTWGGFAALQRSSQEVLQ